MTGVNPLTQVDPAALRSRRSMKWRKYPDDVLPLWVAEMDTLLAPPIAERLHAAVDLGDTGYAAPGQLAEALAGFASARFGWWPDPAEMTFIGDVAQAVVRTLEAITAPGDAVLLNTPAYPPFFADLADIGRRIKESPLARTPDGYRLDLDLLARDFAAPEVTAYLLVNPHNPTGLVLSREELTAVAALADAHGVRVIADEIHAPLTYPGVEFVPYLSVPGAGRGIAFHAASKAWNLAGLKAALIVPGPDAVADVRRIPENARYTAGLLGIIASETAYRSGGAWLDALIAGLDANRKLCGELLAAHLPAVGYVPPDGTYFAWLDCRALGLSAEPADVFLERGRVALYPGPAFGAPGVGHVRLNLATSPDILTQAVERMAAATRSGFIPSVGNR
ncbi:cystathionine beta-lyase [Virgisporangium aliadipatigenens]|uniref:cysteine-S-conjugate beta-lyase n=1 Tax=Virgisporangium aliadipatigenens TaxID=741659 RepID=A0A8J4DSJ7_9ACTN|nr:aminotransferase class I/II-fold pyridoxal phosphate-dependent enzyme [Virgisporangium aliadipatigenens]GIJ47307.1 cystathionine beta-lyase [Virgisporangium aliadipatigenens]